MYSVCYQCTTVIVLWKWVSFFETTYEAWASLFSRVNFRIQVIM